MVEYLYVFEVGVDQLVEYRFKFWLTQNNSKVFGEGPVKLLKKVHELGSLRQAAIAMDMSYSKAWKMIKNVEEGLSISVLERSIGGAKGGGSSLTIEAISLISRYETLIKNIELLITKEVEAFNQA